MLVTREMCMSAKPLSTWDTSGYPVQSSLGGDPWRVAVASMLLCRARRKQIEAPLAMLLTAYPVPGALARASLAHVEQIVYPCGFQRNRARQLTRFSSLYPCDSWTSLRELPGVGLYVNDAVGLFCFGLTVLDSDDEVLRKYATDVATMLMQ